MVDNALKTPLTLSLNEWATKRIASALSSQGKFLPASVAEVIGPRLVKINFEINAPPITLPQITVPLLYPPYIYYPITVGDKGMVISADTYISNMTGLGPSTAPDLTTPPNLAALAFLWLGNKNDTATLDTAALVLMANIIVDATHLGFFGTAKVAQQTVTGALDSITDPNAKAVLNSLVNALANYGLIIDGTT